MKYALFLGCTIPARSRQYELSARKVGEKMGIQLVDLKEFVCCGFPIKASDRMSSMVLAAYNLCMAQERHMDILTLCSSCSSALTEAAYHLANDHEARRQVNMRLSKVNLRYDGKVKVRHFARVLYEEVGAEAIKAHLHKDLSGLRIALHYGCHYLKPSEIYDGFDKVEDPKSLDNLVALTGAEVIEYTGRNRCCGGPILPVDEKLAMTVAREKLEDVSKSGADAMCLVCPFCAVMYDGNQRSIEKEYDATYNLPVLYLTQILGLAMGFDRKELGLNMNVVKTGELLSKYFYEG
jgi:heterodisulfide reductase subunit B